MSGKAVPEGRYADVGEGLTIHYHEQGRGPAVVMLHGSGPGASGYSNFRGNFPYLAERGFRVIVPDTIGFGYSSKPDDVDYTLDFLAGALRRLLDQLGVERCAVVGNSHGGALAIKLALDAPALVSRLVLMAPGGLEEREVYMKMPGIRAMMKAVMDPAGITRESMRRVFELQLHDPTQISAQTIEERYQIATLQPSRVMTTLRVPHLAPELGRLACPVFGLWGTDDKFCPPSGAVTLAHGCADSRVLLISRCGHWVMVEHPDLFNRQCADFLAEG
jgi:4,5:9,10-diseco-3-hydroxy-5,9,17-trioxoandrosta-1(10),2-diene-4-oate hydrolase